MTTAPLPTSHQAATAALLAWVEAQHAYPHALLAHLANTLPIIMMIVT